jgi:EAL domain-containing protein (putative c-di-GMP-specific phosphodiesterase class I)/PAS domain-containing protein
MSAMADVAVHDLLEFLYLMPVGVIRFDTDGGIDMLNPMASQLLMPLIHGARLVNIFDDLRQFCPELHDKVSQFREAAGTVIDQRRLDARAGSHHMTLSLTVTRIRQNVHMAVLKDITRLTEMLAYAFASADLLIEVDADNKVLRTGGAFRTLFGIDSQAAVGKPLSTLFGAEHHRRIDEALMVARRRGRLSPCVMRLANATRSRCVLSGIVLEGPCARFLLTVGPLPSSDPHAERALVSSHEFTQVAENWLRSEPGGALGLVRVHGWETTTAALNVEQMAHLRQRIGQLSETPGGGGLLLGEVADGRFGVLGRGDADLGPIGGALRELVSEVAGAPRIEVAGAPRIEVEMAHIDLDTGTLSPAQSVRALRLALSQFAAPGSAALPPPTNTLAGMVDRMLEKKRALSAIIAGGEFTLAYQPIVHLADRSVHHYEALIRPGPAADALARSPQDFVTMVETVGLSQELDLAVLRRALEMLTQTTAAIAVNVSSLSIVDPMFGGRFLALVKPEWRRRLMVEVTETAEIDDLTTAAAAIAAMRAAGVAVYLDDFGAGHASFGYLRALTVDCVKIDGSYVRAALRDEQGCAFVRIMHDLARSVGAHTLAEMVETEAEAALMLQLGITYGQGWLFGRPGPIAPLPGKPSRWKY